MELSTIIKATLALSTAGFVVFALDCLAVALGAK
jgi:hypothetical protein